MKKIISLVLAGILILSFAGCKQSKPQQEETKAAESSEPAGEKVYIYMGKEYKASELSPQTIEWLEMDPMSRSVSNWFPYELHEDPVD